MKASSSPYLERRGRLGEKMGKKAHVLVVPFAQQGHINPLLQLSKTLASRGLSVTFVLTLSTLAARPPQQQQHQSSGSVRFAGVPDGLPPERAQGSSFRDSYDSMANMLPGVEQLLQRLQSQEEHPVTLILYDVFMIWAGELASKFALPHLAFFTSNATSCSVFRHAIILESQGILPFSRDENDNFASKGPVENIPGVAPLLPADFPLCLTFDASSFRFRYVIEMSKRVQKASGIILNTFEELEERAMAALRKEVPIYAVGPLLLLGGKDPSRLDFSYWPEQDDCLHWLDTREASSVLYVSFGSVASLPVSHLIELALGLEASQQPFLWVIRQDSVDGSLSDILPEGFLTRTKDRGLIISWGPQLQVLSHSAVGAFLSHCGWNSIVENLSTGGVPMICWPHVAEQRLNSKLLVDEWKIGMEFQHTEDGMVKKEEAEKVVRAMMQGQEGKDRRSTANKLRDTARKVVEEGGSSYKNFEALIGVMTP